METKKSNRADLEKKRSMFFQTGLLIALGLAFVAFEWRVAPRISDITWEPFPEPDVKEVKITRTFVPDPPPPAPPQPSFEFEIVTDEISIDDGLFDIDWERGENIIPGDIFTPPSVIDEVNEDIPFVTVEDMPKFNGKEAETGFREYMLHNLDYPEIAIQNDVSGKVFVEFIVDQKGNIIDARVVRGVDASLDNEALRLIRATSGMWSPGKQRDKPVKVRFIFPVTFRLQ